VVMVVMVVMVLAVHLVNLDHLVNREKHSDKDHRLSVEGAKEIEERGGKSIEVGQNHAVVLDRSGMVTSQYHTSSRDRMVTEESTALVDLVAAVALVVKAAAAVAAALAELVVKAVKVVPRVLVAAAVKAVKADLVALAVEAVTAVQLDMMASVVSRVSAVVLLLVVDGTISQEIS
jgi:hypothetical protein